MIRQVRGAADERALKGHVSKDHIHLLALIPPRTTINRLSELDLSWLP